MRDRSMRCARRGRVLVEFFITKRHECIVESRCGAGG
jgi:hypothetical protein